MKWKEQLYLDKNILHAVRIEQPNADGRAIHRRYNKLLGHDEENVRILSIGVMYNQLGRLEEQGLIRIELRNVKQKGREVEKHYFFTMDKGKKKDSKY